MSSVPDQDLIRFILVSEQQKLGQNHGKMEGSKLQKLSQNHEKFTKKLQDYKICKIKKIPLINAHK